MRLIQLMSCLLLAGSAFAADYFVYFGTYTNDKTKSKGIYMSRFDTATGKIGPVELAGESVNPSFVALHPNKRFAYAVGEVAAFQGQKSGVVVAFARDPHSGKLTLLNRQSSKGEGPCFVTVDRSGKFVLTANYGSGSVAAFPIQKDGSLGEASSWVQHTGSGADPGRQSSPHAHSINLSPDNRFAIAADLGTDKVIVYRFDSVNGKLTPNDPPFAKAAPGSGPRHFAFHPSGKFAYVINEMAQTVTAFTWDAQRGILTQIQTINTLPAPVKGNSTAEVVVHPNGKFLYGSNRVGDNIAVFSIDPAKGTLKRIENVPTQGKIPRNFGIDPTGQWLLAAHQDSNNVVVFRIDKETGRLTPTGQQVQVGGGVCVRFIAAQ